MYTLIAAETDPDETALHVAFMSRKTSLMFHFLYGSEGVRFLSSASFYVVAYHLMLLPPDVGNKLKLSPVRKIYHCFHANR